MVKNTLSIYFPDKKANLIDRLQAIAEKQERSVNFIVLKAIQAYVEKEEK